MSQSRPPRLFKHHIERPSTHTDPPHPTLVVGSVDSSAPPTSSAPTDSLTNPKVTSADRTLTPPGTSMTFPGTMAPRRAPSQWPRPDPQDGIMLATGKSRQTERPKPPTQEQIRRQSDRKAWVPNQHGA